MSLHRYIPRIDVAGVVVQLGRLLRLGAFAYTVPLAAAVFAGEQVQVARFAALAVGMFVVGELVRRWALGDDSGGDGMGQADALVVTAIAYPLAAVVGAIAFGDEVPFVDAFFESMSGFTTTGLSVVSLEGLPRSLLFFRAYAQWLGGVGIVMLSVALLSGPRGVALRLYGSEYHDELLTASARSTARTILAVYLGLTVVTAGAYLAAGLGPVDAVQHALATVSTGGFSPHPESLGRFGEGVAIVAVGVMLLAAIPFPLHHLAVRTRSLAPYRDPQLGALVVVLVGAAGFLFLMEGGGLGAVFDVASATTTTGFSRDDCGAWSDLRKVVVTVSMLLGGPTGSSAGGIKLVRALLVVRLVQWALLRRVLPREAQLSVKYRGRSVDREDLLEHGAVVALYLGISALVTVALAGLGVPFVDAAFESASAMGTVGLSTGITSATLPVGAKLALAFEMWAGRLEVVAVLAILHPRVWIANTKP